MIEIAPANPMNLSRPPADRAGALPEPKDAPSFRDALAEADAGSTHERPAESSEVEHTPKAEADPEATPDSTLQEETSAETQKPQDEPQAATQGETQADAAPEAESAADADGPIQVVAPQTEATLPTDVEADTEAVPASRPQRSEGSSPQGQTPAASLPQVDQPGVLLPSAGGTPETATAAATDGAATSPAGQQQVQAAKAQVPVQPNADRPAVDIMPVQDPTQPARTTRDTTDDRTGSRNQPQPGAANAAVVQSVNPTGAAAIPTGFT